MTRYVCKLYTLIPSLHVACVCLLVLGVFTREGLPSMTSYIAGIGIIYILAVIVRGMYSYTVFCYNPHSSFGLHWLASV